jgi:hypothetical protein
MGNVQKWLIFALSFGFSLQVNRVNALPGDAPEDVATWIASHPTLAPATSRNGLFVRKNNTAAQRFTFQAISQSPNPNQKAIITTERLAFFDMVNGVTTDRLEETLRAIYGSGIYQDFVNARITYNYPTPETLDLARRRGLPLLAAQNGQLRLGERFAYWIEITNTDTGIAYNGHVEILLKDALPTLETRLRERATQ